MQGRSSYSPVPCYRRGVKSVVQNSRISFSETTSSFSTTYSTFDWSSGRTFPVFVSPNSSFREWSICDWTNTIFGQSHSPFGEWPSWSSWIDSIVDQSHYFLESEVAASHIFFNVNLELTKQGGTELVSDQPPPSSWIASFDWDSLIEPRLPSNEHF